MKLKGKIAMGLIFAGGLIAFYIAFMWFAQGNIIMGIGMFSMALVALSNFYLHGISMKKGDKN